MTFTEAAEAVLRKVGKPLHYKKITQLAIEQNLLSHVGKTPEVTMSTRLATLSKKDRGEAAIIRVKPGVFGLRDWGSAVAPEATEDAESEEPTEAAEELEETEIAAAEAPESGEVAKAPVATMAAEGLVVAATPVVREPAPRPAPPAVQPVDAVPRSAEEQERAERIAAAGAMFPEEADDDEPVLAERPAAAAEGERASDAGRRRRRRRRRGRGNERGEGVGGEGSGDLAADAEDAGDDAAGPSLEPMEDDEPASESAPNGGDESPAAEAPRDAWRREPRRDDAGPREEVAGRDAADVIVSLLTRRDDRQGVPLRVLAEDAARSGKVSGEPNLIAPTLAAAARADGARRELRGERPRLRIVNGRVSLVDWALGPDFVRAEADALIALERLRDVARRQLVRRLNELPQPAFLELMVLLLERVGISSLKPTRRPGLPQGEVHLSGVARRAGEELRVAVLVKRGGEVGRERVIELRGSLHHYGNAAAAWVVTTGNVLSGAREEAAQPGASAVTVIDGAALGRLFDENGVGVRHVAVNVPYPDLDLLESLRS